MFIFIGSRGFSSSANLETTALASLGRSVVVKTAVILLLPKGHVALEKILNFKRKMNK